MFTTQCFIRINTSELRKELEDLGYKLCPCTDCNVGALFTCDDGEVHILMDEDMYVGINEIAEGKSDTIDCGTNESLFLALAALRDDTNYMQWFYNQRYNEWSICEQDNMFDYFNLDWCCHARKATPEELIDHFKDR